MERVEISAVGVIFADIMRVDSMTVLAEMLEGLSNESIEK